MVVKGRVSTQRGENALMDSHMGVAGGISTVGRVCGRVVFAGLTPSRKHRKTKCGSWLAGDSGVSATENMDCYIAIAGKPAPTF
ncbi:hypothetical protein DJ480_09770 [Pseudomonas sp. Leaf98]|nr:hypothetical protein DJ480_09770 [Pseudomonas sp. Leaf98]